MAIGTQITINQNSNFTYLPKDDPGQLKLKVELGYLKIEPRNAWVQNSVNEFVNNPFYESPGGKKGETFANDYLKNFKSMNLKAVANGIMPSPLDPGGAPFCTFVEGSITHSTPHPYYDLITAPKDEIVSSFDSQANFSINTPLITTNFFNSVNNLVTEDFNKLGSPFIPSTTKTSTAVASANISPGTTYNIWSINNLGTSPSQNYNLVEFLGYDPKSGTQAANLQPYAQTWPFTDAAQIQVYSSNAQVELRRKYPMARDYAHNDGTKYLLYNSSGGSGQLDVNPVGLKNAAVGFTLVFSSVVTQSTIPVAASTNTVLTEPRLIVSWGALDDPNSHTAKNYISLYTLELSPNRNPRLYFNISSEQVKNLNNSPNFNSIELKAVKQINASDRNSGAKTPNDYKLYVFYSGPYLYIGSDPDPETWQPIAYQSLQVQNSPSSNQINLYHYLDHDSQISINAQFMNFSFMYGPPLFNPHDDQNLPSNQNNPILANTLNQVKGISILGTKDHPPAISDFQTFMSENYAYTFDAMNDASRSSTFTGGASAYPDARSSNPVFDFHVNPIQSYVPGQITQDTRSFLNYKMTFPHDLGGHVYNKCFASQAPEHDPLITESYVNYLSDVLNGLNVETILTQAVDVADGFQITKKVDSDLMALFSELRGLTFTNLNRSNEGRTILNFMRLNVAVIRISSGYGKNLNVFFEGAITDIQANERLDSTKITVKAEDLMNHLYKNPNTSILSRNLMMFPGMYYDKIIKNLVYFTELNNHFQYDLIDPTDNKNGQLLSNLKNRFLPKKADTFLKKSLATLMVSPYTPGQHYEVLKNICQLGIQTTKNEFDVPIIYWFADEHVDGIIMSSRKLNKDRDLLFLRKSSLNIDLVSDINQIHGYVNKNGFDSVSNSDNLNAVGIYRFTDINGKPNEVIYQNTNWNVLSPVSPIYSSGYIGYNRTLMFDKMSGSQEGSVYLNSMVLPDYKHAYEFVSTWMGGAYGTVYENITLSALVTKPLKEHGFFNICVESDSDLNSINYVQLGDDYMYQTITYNFNLNENIIEASISGSKKSIA